MKELMDFPKELEPLLPSDEDVEFYREHGWYMSRPIFTDEELDAAIAGQEAFYQGERDNALARDQEFLRGWQLENGDVLRKNDYASLVKNELAALVRKPILGAVAARLTGRPIRLWHDQLLYKPVDNPQRKANVGWHTDRGYWMTASSDEMLTAWVPFHACDERMGTITMIDGSHRWSGNEFGLNFFDPDLDALEKKIHSHGQQIRRVPMNLERGCVSFHHCRTIHGSGPNRGDKPRRSIAIHLQDGPNRYQAYTMPDGTLAPHHNNVYARKVDGVPDYTDPDFFPQLWPRP